MLIEIYIVGCLYWATPDIGILHETCNKQFMHYHPDTDLLPPPKRLANCHKQQYMAALEWLRMYTTNQNGYVKSAECVPSGMEVATYE